MYIWSTLAFTANSLKTELPIKIWRLTEAGEVAQQLSALTVFAENLGSVPQHPNSRTLNCSSRGLCTSAILSPFLHPKVTLETPYQAAGNSKNRNVTYNKIWLPLHCLKVLLLFGFLPSLTYKIWTQEGITCKLVTPSTHFSRVPTVIHVYSLLHVTKKRQSKPLPLRRPVPHVRNHSEKMQVRRSQQMELLFIKLSKSDKSEIFQISTSWKEEIFFYLF